MIHRGSYMSAHVILNLLIKLGKSDKMRGLPSICDFFATSLIHSILQEHTRILDYIYHMTLKLFEIIFGVKTLGFCHMRDVKRAIFVTFPENL